LPSGSSPTPEPVKWTAWRVTSTLALGFEWATTTSAVIIFVRLAIGSTRVGRRCHSTLPVRTSNSSPLRTRILMRALTRSRAGASPAP
jgi:hypothetical protein